MKAVGVPAVCLLTISVLMSAGCSLRQSEKAAVFEKDELSIGVDEGDDNDVFWSIADICVNDRGDIFVLDSRKGRIQAYDENGVHQRNIGKIGEGPGEFTAPSALLSGKGLIWVLHLRKISVFNENGDFQYSFPLDFRGLDMAFLGSGELMILGPKGENIFHAYSLEGEYLYSFGDFMDMPDEYRQIRGAELFRTPLKLFVHGDRIYVMSPYDYEIFVWENAMLKTRISRKMPGLLKAQFTYEGGGLSAVVPDYFIEEKQDRLFVFYSKDEKSGLDIWSGEKLEASYVVEDVPTTTDRNGKYYFIELKDYFRVLRKHMEIQ